MSLSKKGNVFIFDNNVSPIHDKKVKCVEDLLLKYGKSKPIVKPLELVKETIVETVKIPEPVIIPPEIMVEEVIFEEVEIVPEEPVIIKEEIVQIPKKEIFMQFRTNGEFYIIDGLPINDLLLDIKCKWRVDAGSKILFDAEDKKISFHKFFVLDINYIFKSLYEIEDTKTDKDILEYAITGLESIGWLDTDFVPEPPLEYDFDKLEKFSFTPREYQYRFFKTYIDKFRGKGYNGCVLEGSVGSGKTFTAVATLEIMKVDTFIIVVPKPAVKDVWINGISGGYDLDNDIEIKSFFKEPTKSWNIIDDPKMLNIKDKDCKYFVFNYEKMKKIETLLSERDCGKIGIILDESHNCTEMTSNRTKRFLDICSVSRSKNILWLSATPIKGQAKEVLPILKSIAPEFTKEVEYLFKKSYCGDNERTLNIVGDRYKSMAFPILRSEYMTVPEPIHYSVDVILPEELAERYIIDNIRKEIKEAAAKLLPIYVSADNEFVTHIKSLIKSYSVSNRSKIQVRHHEQFIERINHLRKFNDEYMYLSKNKVSEDDFDGNYFEDEDELEESDIVFDKYGRMTHGPIELMLKYNNDKTTASQYKRFCKDYLDKVSDWHCLRGEDLKYFRKCAKVMISPKQHLQGYLLGTYYTNRRIECYTNLVKYLNWHDIFEQGESKALIFSDHIAPIDEAYKIMQGIGLKTSVVHGNIEEEYGFVYKMVKGRKKKVFNKVTYSEIQNFRHDPTTLIIAATFSSLGASKDLIQADKVILIDQSFRHYIKTQGIGRIDRYGQIHQGRVYNVYLNTGNELNLSMRTKNLNRSSQEIAEAITGANLSVQEIVF